MTPRPIRLSRLPFVHAGALMLALLATGSATAVDWNAAKETELTLFYPGQASWEWALTQADHSGAAKFREGKNCRGCHDGEQADIGAAIIAGGHALEPAPMAGRPGSTKLFVRTARDSERLYFQLRWKAAAPSGTKLSKDAAHVTVMLDDGGIRESARAGCWASCHDDAKGMASAAPDSDLTKYLGGSRAKMTRQGGGTAIKPAAEIDALLAQNGFLEYWQARLNPGQPATAVSGYILDRRHEHATPANSAEAAFADGEWRVTLSRPLAASGPGQKAIAPGKKYSVGFALHDDYSDHRFHFVSLEYTLQLDSGDADFIAK
jgi:hypothetical protein